MLACSFFLASLGVEPEKRKIIVEKLGYLEPAIYAIAKRLMIALTIDELFESLPYKKLKRPIYPMDGYFATKLRLL